MWFSTIVYIFGVRKLRSQNNMLNDNDTTTYILVGLILVTILLGALKILLS